MGATLLLLHWADRPKPALLIASGLLYGIAFLMKQPGILFPVFGVLCLVHLRRRQLNWRDVAIFGTSVALPFGITCALLWHAGVFGRFWLWVFTYARSYVSTRPLAVGVQAFRIGVTPIVTDNPGICLLAAA